MKSFRATLCCLLVVCSALAAPAPPVFFKSGWDCPVDPDKDCKIIQTEDMLTIELPGKAHDIVALGKLRNAPRLVRDVKGDFRMDVRVSGDWSLSAASTLPGQSTYAGGGLLVILGDEKERLIRLEYGLTQNVETGVPRQGFYACFRCLSFNPPSVVHMYKLFTADAGKDNMHLRFECRENTLRAYYSTDGKKWVNYQEGMTYPLPMTAKLKVGLAGYSTSKERCKVYFDQFKLTPLKP